MRVIKIIMHFSQIKLIPTYRVIKTDCRGLTTCHTQYTSDMSICIFLFNGTTLKVFVTYLRGACMCTLCDSTNINRKIEFVPNRL